MKTSPLFPCGEWYGKTDTPRILQIWKCLSDSNNIISEVNRSSRLWEGRNVNRVFCWDHNGDLLFLTVPTYAVGREVPFRSWCIKFALMFHRWLVVLENFHQNIEIFRWLSKVRFRPRTIEWVPILGYESELRRLNEHQTSLEHVLSV